MKRGSNGDAFLKLLERVRKTIPGVTLRTSFIVGFPGETKDDFKELYQFVAAAKIDWMGVFEYSDVDNAASFPLDGKVDAETIAERRARLMALQRKISRENLRAHKGRTETALVEGPSKDNPMVWEARLEGMAPDIDGKLYLTDIETANGELAAPGDAVEVEITKTDAYDLIGRVVEILPRPEIRPMAMVRAVPPAEKLTRISTGAALRVIG
jgi:ribosomal protein S12 methylthiotransferase